MPSAVFVSSSLVAAFVVIAAFASLMILASCVEACRFEIERTTSPSRSLKSLE
eukprot:CAMPEP_0172422506 /NCGR_PEP_ID=MMETSP1064-20121228/8649_1 /TAXON_ID=202472 /ORGANISM="Aulacoseira subarctica , Strain CCAP 1002/5" /LENGTH=52 /DNA_ID=CAMNT_0013163391 /DNA_START=20 /DNA_END=178 /DNA_ORIENTATION=+